MKAINTTNLSKQTIAAVKAAGLTLLDILSMDAQDLSSIKGIGPRREAELKIFRIRNINRDKISADDIKRVREYFSTKEIADMLAHPKTYAWFRAVHLEFLSNEKLDEKIAHTFNRFRGDDLLSKRIGEASKSLPKFHWIGEFSTYNIDMAYKSLALTIFNGLVELGLVDTKDVPKPYIGQDGRRRCPVERHIIFDGENNYEKDPLKGIHFEPGKVNSSRVKVKPGGIAYKYNKLAKDYLKLVSSQSLELVEISEEEFKTACKKEKWYTTKSDNFHTVLKNAFIDETYDIYQSLLDRTIYLSMWFDYRYRAYYEFSNTVFGPHTKLGKYMWQSTEAIELEYEDYELFVESAVTIGTGKRHNIQDAMKVWEKDEDSIVESLLATEDKYFGSILYQRRLVQAIEDYRNGIPSKFLLAGDNTNGGLQIFSAEFQAEQAGKSCNIGGLKTPQDSHMPTANAFGTDRDTAKAINQPVFHAGGYSVVAKDVYKATGKEVSASQVKQFLIEAFGEEIVYINEIGDYARSLYDNYNTTLKAKTLDGLPFQSTGFIEHMEVKVFGMTNLNKKRFSSIIVGSDMPLLLTNSKAEAIYPGDASGTRKKGEKRKAVTKMSGTYANITHAVDGWDMRSSITPTVQAGFNGIQVHDMYIYQPRAHRLIIRPQHGKNLIEIMRRKPYLSAITQMNENREGIKIPVPKFKYGTLTEEHISESKCYISA